jgi:hypothetical protein
MNQHFKLEYASLPSNSIAFRVFCFHFEGPELPKQFTSLSGSIPLHPVWPMQQSVSDPLFSSESARISIIEIKTITNQTSTKIQIAILKNYS